MEYKNKYEVGKDYRNSEIPQESTEEMTVTEYGMEYLGQHAVHVKFFRRYEEDETDVWFIWDSQANEGIFKCVYNK